MDKPVARRCAIYTRKSSENGLEQSFNSLDAQREACEAYIKSQTHEGWLLRPSQYDDGGISGGHMERPALRQLIEDIETGLIDIVVVYKVDRLSRSLSDFVRLVQLFDDHQVSFVSVTQHFNTSSSMGRLTLNVLLSFAQFEREVTSERIRDKIAASKRKGMWMGGRPPLGYDVQDKRLVANAKEAEVVRHIYACYLQLRCVRRLKEKLDAQGFVSKVQKNGQGGVAFSRGSLYTLLRNPLYVGKVRHKGRTHDGQHEPIVEKEFWESVQQLLKSNRSRAKRRDTAKEPSLLAGLLFDDRGHPMSPTHATKDNRRYRYYISQAVLRYVEEEAGTVKRVSAKDVEKPVLEQLRKLFGNPSRLVDSGLLMTRRVTDIKCSIGKADGLARTLADGNPRQQIGLLNEVVSRIEIGQSELVIQLNPSAVRALLDGGHSPENVPEETAELLTLRSSVELGRCGSGNRIIIGEALPTRGETDGLKAIQHAVLKALEWSDALLRGKARTVTELAEKEGLSQRYLSSMMPLAWLAPDIVERLAQGNCPPGLTLENLKKGFPQDWCEQRERLGLPMAGAGLNDQLQDGENLSASPP
jgi:DNA invertase Pin-like site-specific DNA recombinase